MSEAADRSDTEDELGASGAARRLGLSAERVRQLITEGALPARKTVLGHLVKADDVEALRVKRERERAGG